MGDHLKAQIDLVLLKLDDDDSKRELNLFLERCRTEADIETLLVRYRHLISDDRLNEDATIYEPLNRPITIGYLLNEDKIFYSQLDLTICNYLRNEGNDESRRARESSSVFSLFDI